MCAKAMPILLQPVSNNFDRYVEHLWTFKSVGHKCTEAGTEAGQYLRPHMQMFRVKLHYNNVVVDRGTRDDLSADHKGVIGK